MQAALVDVKFEYVTLSCFPLIDNVLVALKPEEVYITVDNGPHYC
jgi:hypothetical protein